MQLGQASTFSQDWIQSSLKLVGSNPPSGKETKLGQCRMLILLRWQSLCRPTGKDFNFAQLPILRFSRDALLGKLFAIDSIFGQLITTRYLRAVGNSFFDDKDVSSMHDQISRRLSVVGRSPLDDKNFRDGQPLIYKSSRREEELEEASPSSAKNCKFSQNLISSVFKI